MSVYVGTMKANYRGMVMCRMVADTTAELLAMADTIGVERKWIQSPGTAREHFDICLAKKHMAMRAGAVEKTQIELGRILRAKRHA